MLLKPFHIAVIDDGSTQPLAPGIQHERLYLLRHTINLGQGAALQTGFLFALRQGADYVITYDADGQHSAADIDLLLEPLIKNEADLALGSRFMPGASHNATRGRQITLRLARLVNYCFTGLRLSDAHNGLRALNRKALTTIYLSENRMAHATEILIQAARFKLRYREVPVHILYTDYSKKKGQSAFNSIRIFFDLVLHKLFE